MVARRSALKDSQEKLPKVLEEAGMRHYIAVRSPFPAPLFPSYGFNSFFLSEPQVHHPHA